TAREVLAVCLREADATTGGRQEDCLARAALLACDLGDAAAAAAHAARATSHPSSARLIVAQAFVDGGTAAPAPPAEAAPAPAYQAELAEGYLYRAGDGRRAAAASEEPDDVRTVALALAGDFAAVASQLAGSRVGTDLYEAAHLQADRLGQPALAAAFLESARGRDPYPTPRLLDLAGSLSGLRVPALPP